MRGGTPGQTPDTSVSLQYSLWGPICIKRYESQYESGRYSQQALGMSADLASAQARPPLAGRHDDNSSRPIAIRTAGE